MKRDAEPVFPNQSRALYRIGYETRIGVSIHEGNKSRIGLMGTSGLQEGGEDGCGGVLPLSRHDELEEGLGV